MIIIRVLIVDDQKLIRESLMLMIDSNTDMEVIATASDGREAYEYCCRFKPDLVLMDISMPDCDGLEATNLIKAKFPYIKILMLTSSSDLSDAYNAIKNGADGYILKDIGKEELILSIKSTVAGLGIIHKEILESFSGIGYNQIPAGGKGIEVEGVNISLTDRQLHVIKMIVEGYDNKSIGSKLYIAEGTVKNIITEIISKLQLKDRTQLAVYAIKNNLVQ